MSIKPTSDISQFASSSFVHVDSPSKNFRDSQPSVFDVTKLNDIDLFEVTVEEIQHYYSNGQLDAVTYTCFCLENIRKVRGSIHMLGYTPRAKYSTI